MRHLSYPAGVAREDLLEWYREARARSRVLFDLIAAEAYYDRPIPLRNPLVFYDGHLPAFSVNTLIKLALRRPGLDQDLEVLFARGIDPESEAESTSPTDLWLSRETVRAYSDAADELVRSSGLPLGEVARRLGFEEQASLTRAFIRWFGRSPSAARRAWTCEHGA